MKECTVVNEKELKKLAEIYKQLSEPKRNIFVMSGNLLLASQQAEGNDDTRKAG
ncbi:hypothetical protein [Enterocloster sp.]|uniref:hypothetical protein n=1 Tax=Enterocloster sp. TaxID=2719315 RepID=UPI0039A1CF80